MCINQEILKAVFKPQSIKNKVNLNNNFYHSWFNEKKSELYLFPADKIPQSEQNSPEVFLGDHHWSIYLEESKGKKVKGHAKWVTKNHEAKYRHFEISFYQKKNQYWLIKEEDYIWNCEDNKPANTRNVSFRHTADFLTADEALKTLGSLIVKFLNK